MYPVTEEQIMALGVYIPRFRVVVRVRRSCRPERALAPREIASAFGRKERLVDANSSHEATTVLKTLGDVILCLDENSGDVERLRANRELVPNALEEALRYYSPVKLVPRWAVTETTNGDQRIEAGQLLLAWNASANRDEAEFPDANQFNIEREPNRHLAFGRSIHFCLGAPLARLEAKIALGAMLDRLPGSWQVPDAQLSPIKSMSVFGMKKLPLTWEK